MRVRAFLACALWLLLGTAHGCVLTFVWDASPLSATVPGITYELEVNGQHFVGITGTTQNVDLPGVEGTLVDARVRAVPPNDQPSLSVSDWITFRAQIPHNQTGFRAYLEKVASMAIAKYGFTSITSSANTIASGARAETVTVPTGARTAVVSFGGYSNSGALNFTSVSINGKSSVASINSNVVSTSAYQVGLVVVRLDASDEGAGKTLAWTNSSAVDEGGSVIIRWLGETDVSPVRSSGVAATGSSGATVTSGSLTGLLGDLIIGAAASYQPTQSVSWSAGTPIASVVGGGVDLSVAETDLSGNGTLTATGAYPGLCAFVLKPSSGSAVSMRAGGAMASAGRKAAGASTAMRAGARRVDASGQKSVSYVLTARGGGRTAATGARSASGVSAFASGARSAAVCGKQVLSSASFRGGCRSSANGVAGLGISGSASLTGGARAQASATKAAVGHVAVSAGSGRAVISAKSGIGSSHGASGTASARASRKNAIATTSFSGGARGQAFGSVTAGIYGSCAFRAGVRSAASASKSASTVCAQRAGSLSAVFGTQPAARYGQCAGRAGGRAQSIAYKQAIGVSAGSSGGRCVNTTGQFLPVTAVGPRLWVPNAVVRMMRL